MRTPTLRDDIETVLSAPIPWSDLDGASVLIAGAGGFLGSYMAEILLYRNEVFPDRKVKVICLVRNQQSAQQKFGHHRNRADLELIAQDVCDPVNCRVRADYIIHAAAKASPKSYGIDPVGVLAPNVLGTHNLLTLAQRSSARSFLFLSSAEIYGAVPDRDQPIKESCFGYLDPTDIRSCYAESKRAGETMCVSWFHQHKVPTRIVRPFHVYGHGISADDGRVQSDFLFDALRGRDIVMRSDGSAMRSFCYIADAAAGFFTVLLKGRTGTAYNIGNDKAEASIKQFAELLIAARPGGRLRVITDLSQKEGYLRSKINRSCPDITRARSLGWDPRTPLEEGVRRTVLHMLAGDQC